MVLYKKKMKQSVPGSSPIRLLIVDDSWVLRKVLRGTLTQRDDINIIGEATNGVQALELILKEKPDVILLDMEMPTMDGMTTLQHLMIHTPTPTIMLSSLSNRGTARCFDALKYGAVEFVSKNSFFKGMDGAAHSKLVLKTIQDASRMNVQAIDPMQQKSADGKLVDTDTTVVFCEECGTKQVVDDQSSANEVIICRKCGDELFVHADKRYRRMNFITVIGAGESGYANILKIIPELTPEMGGSICVVIHDRPDIVESFVKYLDAICDFDVIFAYNGTHLEGGCCYIFSGDKHVRLSSFSGHYTLQMKNEKPVGNLGVIDVLMMSAAACMKNRVAGVILSGSISDGSKGIEMILRAKGSCFVLAPNQCLHKSMVNDSLKRFKLQDNNDEMNLAVEIQKCHFSYKEKVITA